VGVIAAAVARAARVLAASAASRSVARSRGRAGGRGRGVVSRRSREFGLGIVGDEAVGGVVRFGASSEEAVAEVADFGLELSDPVLQVVFALSSALMHGLVVMGLLSE
jgi:hypothetical protein